MPFEVSDSFSTLSVIWIIFSCILDACCDESEISPACTAAPFAISSKAVLITSDAPFVLSALSSRAFPVSARFAEIPCNWLMLSSNLSKNTFKLFPNCENSSSPSALILTAIFPCVILSSAFLKCITFLSILELINTVRPTSMIDAITITIMLAFCTVDFTRIISSEAIFLTVPHKVVSSSFNTLFSAFNARIVSSISFICQKTACAALSFPSESSASVLLVVYSGIFSSISVIKASIPAQASAVSFPSTTILLYEFT